MVAGFIVIGIIIWIIVVFTRKGAGVLDQTKYDEEIGNNESSGEAEDSKD